jgi:hypothetical protein
MATLDVFREDAFGLIEMTGALQRIPYKPQLLGQLGIFQPKPIRTEVFQIENKDGVLSLVKSSPRGAPLQQAEKSNRNIRDFRTVRLAKGDRLTASEIAGIRAFGTESEFVQVQTETMQRMTKLRDDVELTLERHRLGAINGEVLDADGSVLFNWFALWGITPPAEVNFRLNVAETDVRGIIRTVKRTMIKGAKGAWTTGTRVAALCGDAFYDALLNHPQIKETKLNNERAPMLENIGAYSSIEIEGVTFINYQSTDDDTSVAVGSDKVKFFAVGNAEIFQHVMSPGESFEVVNTPGLPWYAMTVPDRDRDMWVDLEVYAYPAMVCTRPETLVRGKRA